MDQLESLSNLLHTPRLDEGMIRRDILNQHEPTGRVNLVFLQMLEQEIPEAGAELGEEVGQVGAVEGEADCGHDALEEGYDGCTSLLKKRVR